ncbi:MAG TPA: hypothetical protein VGB99_17115 [Acidobacteriota bacterium]
MHPRFLWAVSMLSIAWLSAPALAKSAGEIELNRPTQLGAEQIEPGRYTIRWQTHSPEATVTVVQDGRSVATVEAQVVEQEKEFQNTRILVIHGPDGDVLKELGFSGSRQFLVFGD